MELPLEERQSYLALMKQKLPTEILTEWLRLALNLSDFGKTEALARVLADSLHKEGSHDGEYAALKAFLFDPSRSLEQQLAVIRLLGRTATPESVGILLDLFHQNPSQTLQEAVLAQIKHAADERWGDRFHPELSPALEVELVNANPSSDEFRAIALSIAKIGAPSGVSLFLDNASASTSGRRMERLDDAGVKVLIDALRYVENPENISALSQNIGSRSADDLRLTLSATMLISIGGKDALFPVVQWMVHSNEDVSRLIESWLEQVKDTDSIDYLKSVPDEFTNPNNARAFRRSLENL